MRILTTRMNHDGIRQAMRAICPAGDGFIEAEDADELVDLAKHYDFDLIVLVGGAGGPSVRHLRAIKIAVPIVAVGPAAEHDVVAELLNAGADDVWTIGMPTAEMQARAHAIVRRSQGHASPIVESGNLVHHLLRKEIEVNGKRVHLTAREWMLFDILQRRTGATLTKDTLYAHLYDGLSEVEIKIVDVFICKLRKKLKVAGWDGAISTVWGRGYQLNPSAKAGEDTAAEPVAEAA